MNSSATNNIVTALAGYLLVIGLAYSWLIVPYGFGGGDLLAVTGERARTAWLRTYEELKRMLTRSERLSGATEVRVLYAADAYLKFMENAEGSARYPQDRLVFIMEEHAQHGDLASGKPAAVLTIGGRSYAPVAVASEEVPGLQRKTVFQFETAGADGLSPAQPQDPGLQLHLTGPRRDASDASPALDADFKWALPLEFPPGLKLNQAVSGWMLIPLAGGLMAGTLMPCLLQLSLIFLAILGGMSITAIRHTDVVTLSVRHGIWCSALVFCAGFILLFAGAGAAIAYAGKQAQIYFMDSYRYLGVAGGLTLVLYGLHVGALARAAAPSATGVIGVWRGAGVLGTAAVAVAIGLGCFACYGGTLITALLVYNGTPGYSSALVLGLFAAGAAMPFLLSVSVFVRLRQPLQIVERHARLAGSLCMTLIICFGLLLATDSYHTVSDWMYPYLGLD
jgi:hypothetical protein